MAAATLQEAEHHVQLRGLYMMFVRSCMVASQVAFSLQMLCIGTELSVGRSLVSNAALVKMEGFCIQ